jgi:amidase
MARLEPGNHARPTLATSLNPPTFQVAEVWKLNATAQAELVASGDMTAGELVAAALSRADELSGLGAVTDLLPDRANERAKAASGPFAGVPILLKDAGQQLEGTPHWIGTTALKEIACVSTWTTPLARAHDRRI